MLIFPLKKQWYEKIKSGEKTVSAYIFQLANINKNEKIENDIEEVLAEKWTIDYVCKDCSRYKECKSKEHCTKENE